MRSPCGVLGIALNNDRIFVKRIGERKSGFGFLPRIEIVGLLTAEPVGERSPDIYALLDQ